MQVQRISNNNYNMNFGSKIRFKYQSIGGGYHPDAPNKVYEVLAKGMETLDITLLKAYKGLLNDGLNHEYTFVEDCWDRINYLKEKNSTGEKIHRMIRYDELLELSCIRDMIVDIARNQGLVPGKPMGLGYINSLYHSRGIISGDVPKMKKLLEKHGFESNSPKTEKDLMIENQLVQDELNEIERLQTSDSEYKNGYINHIKSIIKDKINAHYRSEYEKIIGTQKERVRSYENSIISN